MATISRLFNNILSNPNSAQLTSKGLPLLNEINSSITHFLTSQGQIRKKKALMRWVKGTPELLAFLNKVSADMTRNYKFVPVRPQDNGRNKVMKANRFAMQVGLRKMLPSHSFDILSTGEGFGWKGLLGNDIIKKELNRILSDQIFLSNLEKKQLRDSILLEYKQEDGINDDKFLDERHQVIKKYQYIPSSTIEVLHDDHEITGYNQIVTTNTGSKPIFFDKKEMLHYTFMDRDGKVNGFASVESVIIQLELLRQMWQNMLSIYNNGGSMDKIIVLEDGRVNSPEYQRIEEQLMKYKLVENKHGNMLFTGKIRVEDLTQLDQMQFKDMGLYITGLLAMQWGIPRSSIPYILGGTNTKDDTGGNSERGYWEVIRGFQQMFMEDMNTQLWIPHFGVKIILENSYFQLDIQREQALQSKLLNVKTMNEILISNKLQLNKDKMLKFLDLSSDDVEDKVFEFSGFTQQPEPDKQMSNDEVNNSDDKKNKNNAKKREQELTIQSAGKPTGFGKEVLKFKEFDQDSMQEYKHIQGKETEITQIDTFIKLYNKDKAISPNPPRLFMRENDMFTSFTFKSTDFVFKTVINNELIPDNAIKIMNLGGDVIRL